MSGESGPDHIARSLKGAPASILWALVLHRGPQTTKHLCGRTGYSVKVVRQGLAHLRSLGLAYCDCDLRAWYLVPGTDLLLELHHALAAVVSPAPGDHPVIQAGGVQLLAEKLSTQLSTKAQKGGAAEDIAADAGYLAAGREGRKSAGTITAVRPGAESAHPRTDSSGAPQADEWDCSPSAETGLHALIEEDPAAAADDYARPEAKSAFSRAPIITAASTSPIQIDQEEAGKHAGTERPKKHRDPGVIRGETLAVWLARGGIAPRSPKMHELLARDPDLEAVKAHVLERLACEAGLVKGMTQYGVGLLIRKLLDGDPPPAMRCETCLQRPDRLGWCGCDYESVVRR